MKGKRGISILLAVVLAVMPGIPAFSSREEAQASGRKEASQDEGAFRYFYSQLGEGAQRLYDAMYEMYSQGIMKSGSEDFELSSRGYVTREQLVSYGEGDSSLLSDYGAARDAFCADYPDIFYVDFSYLSLRVTRDTSGNYHGYLGTGRGDSYYTPGFTGQEQVEEALREYEEKVGEIVRGARELSGEEGENLAQKQVKYVHDYLVRNTTYRLENTCKKENTGTIRTSYGALVRKESACEGYARAMKSVLDRLDIPCVLVQGGYRYSEKDTELHMWNYVKTEEGNTWYGVDATMDDPISRTSDGSGLDGYECSDYLLVGQDVMSRRHTPGGVMSEANFEFSYPDLSLAGCMFERIYSENGLTVMYNKDGTHEDLDAGIFQVSYNGMGYQAAAAKGIYLLGRFHQYYEASGEWRYGEWGYLLPDVYPIFEDTDTEITIPVPHCLYVEFAVTDIAPGDYRKDPNKTAFQGDPMLLQAESGMIYNPSGDYVAPPNIKSITPGLAGRLRTGSTYHVKAVYDDVLQLKEGETQAGYQLVVPDGNATAREHSEIKNFTWDGESTIEFDFMPSKMWADDSIFYEFHITGLVGRNSLKTPNPISYFASSESALCAMRAHGYYWNLFGKPALLENSDLSVKDWKTQDGESVTQEMLNRLVLVATSTTNAQADVMNEEIAQALPGQEKLLKSETYNINLTVCKKVVIETGQSVRVCLGFPAGYGPDDAGVTFKAYHFEKNSAGEIVGIQEIPCIVTQYGLLVLCDSFSPFAIAVVEGEAVSAPGERTVILSHTAGGKLTGADSVFTLSAGEKKTVTVSAEEGYEIEELVVGGRITAPEDRKNVTLQVSYGELADGVNIVDAKFVAAATREKEQARGEEPVCPEAASPEITMPAGSMTAREKSSFTIAPTVSEHQGIYTYQWYKDGKLLPGQRGRSLTVKSAALSDGGAYTLAVANTVDSTSARTISAECRVTVVRASGGGSAAPAAVSGLKASSTAAGRVRLTWKKASGAAGYFIYRCQAGKKKFARIADVAGTSYTDRACRAGTAYRYRVKAYRRASGKSQLTSKSSEVRLIARPSAPKKLKGKKIGNRVRLAFQKVSGASAYQIYRYDQQRKTYILSYRIKGKKLYAYVKQKKKWKYYNKVTVAKSGKITCRFIPSKAAGRYRVRSLAAQSGYKTAESSASKAVKVTR